MEVITRKKLIRVAQKVDKEKCLELEKQYKDIIQRISLAGLEQYKNGSNEIRLPAKNFFTIEQLVAHRIGQVGKEDGKIFDDLATWADLRGLKMNICYSSAFDEVMIFISPMSDYDISRRIRKPVD